MDNKFEINTVIGVSYARFRIRRFHLITKYELTDIGLVAILDQISLVFLLAWITINLIKLINLQIFFYITCVNRYNNAKLRKCYRHPRQF
jgi:hypothetical protein